MRVLAHGLVVDSDVDLALDRPSTAPADVVVRLHPPAPVDPALPPGRVLARLVLVGQVRFALLADEDGLLLHFPWLASARVGRGATRVDVRLDPRTDPGMAAILVNGYLMTTVLKARGHQVLHGTAYAAGGRAVALVGSSGMGKSTSGALACRAGAMLVSDDVLRVAPDPGHDPDHDPGRGPGAGRGAGRPAGTGWVCWPGTTEARLRPAAAALAEPYADAGAGTDAASGTGTPTGTGRSWRSRTRATSDGRHALTPGSPRDLGGGPIPLAEVLVPEPARGAEHASFEPLTGAAALVELSRHPRLVGLEDPAWVREEFEGLSALVRSVPVARARLPWGPPWPASSGRALLARTGVVDLSAGTGRIADGAVAGRRA